MKKITISVHGSSRGNPGPAAIGVQLADAKGTVIKDVFEPIGNATDITAEYYAVMRGFQVALEVYGKSTKSLQIEVKLDSDRVKRQLQGEAPIKEPGVVPWFIEIHNLRVVSFPRVQFITVSKEHNQGPRQLVHELLG